MALIVEDGSNVAGAESYVSVADATTYHAARGNAAWASLASDTVREQMLRKATEYMLQAYRPRWAGYRQHAEQALDWPRVFVPKRDAIAGYGAFASNYDPDTVPEEVKRACAELALRAASGSLLADLGRSKKRVKVGPIETEYDLSSPESKRYAAVDAMLAPFFKVAGGMAVVRS